MNTVEFVEQVLGIKLLDYQKKFLSLSEDSKIVIPVTSKLNNSPSFYLMQAMIKTEVMKKIKELEEKQNDDSNSL